MWNHTRVVGKCNSVLPNAITLWMYTVIYDYFTVTNKKAKAMYYTIIKHDENFQNMREIYISKVFSNSWSVLWQYNIYMALASFILCFMIQIYIVTHTKR